jgi:MazG family protein
MTDDDRRSPTDLGRLRDLVARLRAPDGCPWDRAQTPASVRAYLLEEAHELAAALDAGSWAAVGEELGDLLFQIAFVARLGEEAGALELGAVVAGIGAKMVERHPHVFGAEALPDAAAVAAAWERRKARTAADRAGGEGGRRSLLDGVPASLPALLAAYRTTQKAAGVGFDWPDAAAVFAKLDEEIAELKAELTGLGGGGAGADAAAARAPAAESRGTPAGESRSAPGGPPAPARVAEEVGDLLFTVANLARQLGVDPEAALAAANRKFRDRFRRVEEGLAARGRRLGEATLEEMDALWEEAKGGRRN